MVHRSFHRSLLSLYLTEEHGKTNGDLENHTALSVCPLSCAVFGFGFNCLFLFGSVPRSAVVWRCCIHMRPGVVIDLLLADSHLWYKPCGFSSGFPPVRKSSWDEALLDIKVIPKLKSWVLKRSRRQFRTNLPEVSVLAQRQWSKVSFLLKTCVSERVSFSWTTDETELPPPHYRLYFHHYDNFLNSILLFSHIPPPHPLLLIKPCSPLMENCWFTSHSRGSDNQSSEKQCQVNLLWEWTLGTWPHLCLTCRDTVHQWEPAAQESY